MRAALALVFIALAWPAGADPGREPGPATVAVVHSDGFLLPQSFWTPRSIYPLGKLDYKTVARMLDRAVMLATETERISDAWGCVAKPGDRVGILLDAQSPPASLALVDVLIDRLVRVGIRARDIIIWAQDERSLFSAGLLVRKDPDGVSTMGAESEGYRVGLSRILLVHCDVVVNLARLRADSRIGMWGAVANQLASVPQVERVRLLASPAELPSAAARPLARRRFKLHILDALQPNYEPGPLATPPYWRCGKLLVSRDEVALDRIGQQVLEQRREEVKGEAWPLEPPPEYITAACDAYRLGQADAARITVLEQTVGG